MLLQRAGAVGVHHHLGQMAVMVGVRLVRIAVQVPAVRAEPGVPGDGRRVGLVLLAREMRVPGRQARPAGDPQPVRGGGIDRSVGDQLQRARARVLVEREHGDRRGELAVHPLVGRVTRGVLELHDGEDGVAGNAGRARPVPRQQAVAVRAVGEELGGRRAAVVHDRLAGDVVIPAGQGRAARAVRHRVAGQEQLPVAQPEALHAALAAAHHHVGFDRRLRLRRRGRRRGHADELGRDRAGRAGRRRSPRHARRRPGR